jgi:hypothetical protein
MYFKTKMGSSKKTQKHKRASKSRGQNAAGNAMAAVEPAKSRADAFGQLVCLCNSQTLREPLQRRGETARKTAEI